MADNLTLNAGSGGATLGTDEVTIGGALQHVQRVKLVDGTDGGTGLIGGDASNGLDVDVTRVGGNVTVVGAAADGAAASGNPVLMAGFDGTNTQSIATTAGGLVQIHDGGGSVTVDNGGTFAVQASEADGANVTLGAKADAKSTATDTTAISAMSVWKQISFSVQAIASAIVGTLTVSGTVDTELTTADLDSGAGTDTRAVVGMVMSASGGGALATGDAANGLDVDVTRVSGNVTVVQGTAANLKVDASGVAVPVTDNSGSLTVDAPVGTPVFVRLSDGAAAITNQSTNLAQVAGTTTDTNSGNKSAGTLRVVLATDQPSLSNAIPVSESGTWTVQPGNTANTTPWLTSQQPATAGGCSVDKLISAASTNGANVKNAAGQVYGLIAVNTTATIYYYHIYNKASSPTVGTDVPVMTIPIPANASGAGVVFMLDSGIAFATGIGRSLTSGSADNDSGNAATGVLVQLLYK